MEPASNKEPTTVRQKLIGFSSLEYVARGHQLTLIPFSCHRTLTPTVVLADSSSVYPVNVAYFLRELSTILS